MHSEYHFGSSHMKRLSPPPWETVTLLWEVYGEVAGSVVSLLIPLCPNTREQQNPPQMSKHESSCGDGCSVLGGYLALFKVGFACTKGFYRICWAFEHGFPASGLECIVPFLQGRERGSFWLGDYCLGAWQREGRNKSVHPFV